MSKLPNKKSVLVVSEYFSPTQAVASIRWTKLAKYLVAEHGYSVDVLTNEKDYSGKARWLGDYRYDSTLADDLGYVDRIFEVGVPLDACAINAAFYAARGLKRALMGGKGAGVKAGPRATSPLSGGVVPRDGASNRLAAVSRGVRVARLEAIDSIMGRARLPQGFDPSRYGVMVSSFGPKWPHYVGARIKRMEPGLLWLADYRDPVANRQYYGDTKVNRGFASTVTARADCVLDVGIGRTGNMSLHLPECVRREEIANAYDPDEVLPPRKCYVDAFVISYTGTLYSEGGRVLRDFGPLYRALEDLSSRGEVDLRRVLVVYAGGSGKKFLESASAHPSVPSTDLGVLPRRQALELQQMSALLVFLSWNTVDDGCAITGKVYEYLNARVPVVGICSGELCGSRPKELIEQARVGFCYEQANHGGDYRRLKGFIAEKYAEWEREGTTSCDADDDYISGLSYRARARQLAALIDELMDGKER